MKKFLLAAVGIFSLANVASAQLPYTFSVQNGQTYTPLTGGTAINTGVWDDQRYTVPFPSGFIFRIGGTIPANFFLDVATGGFYTDTIGNVNGFGYDFFTDYADRGGLGSGTVSKSPIRYEVSGTAPNRIFKVELANAGFSEEMDQYNTANDSVNIQMWLYETSNAVELRYGPSSVTHPGDYFMFNGALLGYVKNGDITALNFEAAYTLKGNPASPTIDSVDLPTFYVPVLSSYPPNGTVYRFEAISNGFANGSLAGRALQVFPTPAHEVLNVTYTEEARADYRIVSLTGTTVLQGQLSKGSSKLDIAALAAGTYVLEVQNGSGKAARRFSKL